MPIAVDEKFKKATVSSSSQSGRSVPHASKACEQCRRWKVRCSGSSPCEECQRRGKGEMCVIVEQRRPRGKTNAMLKAMMGIAPKDEVSSNSSSSSSGSVNDDDSTENALQRMTTGDLDKEGMERRLLIVAERLLADEAAGKMLMDIFVQRIHPHMFFVSSTSPSFVFEKVLFKTSKASDAIRRDAGLAMASRVCGHQILESLLTKRMELNFQSMKDEPLSPDACSAVALLGTLISTHDMITGTQMIFQSFEMHHTLFPKSDMLSSVCESLELFSLDDDNNGCDNSKNNSNSDSSFNNSSCSEQGEHIRGGAATVKETRFNEDNGMYNDWASVSKDEIIAHIQMSISQLLHWSQTLADTELLHLVAIFISFAQIAIPQLRPSLVLHMALLIDLHLLGCLTPPYIMAAMNKHDPDNKFSLSGLFKPCISVASLDHIPEPTILGGEITNSLLRRILVCRMLTCVIAKVDKSVEASFLVTIEILEAVIQWRSGNREKAVKIGDWLFRAIEHEDLNFWNPMISQNLLILGSIFFEMKNGLGLVQTISTLHKLRRSQPTADVAIRVLEELQAKMIF